MPAEFGFPSHPSLGIIDFTNPQVVQRMQTIFNEIYEVFGTPIVHMGADEVDFKRLGTLPEIQAALQKQNLTSAVDLYREFIVTMDRFAVASNRTLHVWEGFAPSKGQTGRNAQNASTIDIDPKTGITVQPFDCYYYPPPQLAADGYKIINSAWTPLYIASGHGEDPELVCPVIFSKSRWRLFFFDSKFILYHFMYAFLFLGSRKSVDQHFCDSGLVFFFQNRGGASSFLIANSSYIILCMHFNVSGTSTTSTSQWPVFLFQNRGFEVSFLIANSSYIILCMLFYF